MTKLLISILIVASFLVTGCSRGLLSVHRIDIQQGNMLEETSVDKVKVGMTRQQVEQILGEPVLEPVLTEDRWDYVYYMKKSDEKPSKQVVSIYFKNDKVRQVEK